MIKKGSKVSVKAHPGNYTVQSLKQSGSYLTAYVTSDDGRSGHWYTLDELEEQK